jgi:hypothetical protein
MSQFSIPHLRFDLAHLAFVRNFMGVTAAQIVLDFHPLTQRRLGVLSQLAVGCSGLSFFYSYDQATYNDRLIG